MTIQFCWHLRSTYDRLGTEESIMAETKQSCKSSRDQKTGSARILGVAQNYENRKDIKDSNRDLHNHHHVVKVECGVAVRRIMWLWTSDCTFVWFGGPNLLHQGMKAKFGNHGTSLTSQMYSNFRKQAKYVKQYFHDVLFLIGTSPLWKLLCRHASNYFPYYKLSLHHNLLSLSPKKR